MVNGLGAETARGLASFSAQPRRASGIGLGPNTARAVRIVDEALGRWTAVDGLVDGAASSALDASTNLPNDWRTDLDDASRTTDGVDDTEDASTIAHYQSLADNAVAGLAILQQQRARIVALVEQLAGLG